MAQSPDSDDAAVSVRSPATAEDGVWDAMTQTKKVVVVDRQETAITEASAASSASDIRAEPSVREESPAPSADCLDDESLLSLACERLRDDKILEAARILRRVRDGSKRRRPAVREVLERAERCEAMVAELLSPVNGGGGGGAGWTKQGGFHGKRNTLIYYRIPEGDSTSGKLNFRVETPIEPDLLVPLLSVLNESELYATWLPSFTKPVKLGVGKSDKLSQNGRASQTILVDSYLPWPISRREVIIDAVAFDDIDEEGSIGVKLGTLETGERMGCGGTELDGGDGGKENLGDKIVPPPEGGAVRADFDGGFLFRRCPLDHPTLLGGDGDCGADPPSAPEDEIKEKADGGEKERLLVSVSLFVDGKLQYVPSSIINFVIRTVIGRMWDAFLRVAEDVRDGRRPEHGRAIEAKRERLYDWVEERVGAMLDRLWEVEGSLGGGREGMVVTTQN